MPLLVLVLLAGCGAAPVVSDAALVYCSSHRSETVAAAVALGIEDSTAIGNRVVVDGKTLEFDEWRKTRRAQFERACAAAAEPQMRPPAAGSAPSWIPTLITAVVGLLSTLAGALITRLATNRREDRNRAKEQAVALRKASREFADEVRDYCDAQLRGQASAIELRRKRDQLNTQLAVTKLMRPEWSAPDELRSELDAFAESAEQGWRVKNDRRERQPRVIEVTQAARALDRRIEVVVQALQRPAHADELLHAEFRQAANA
ncbi:hypothetical protein [Lentzea terrae]|uniref:hypothetical protein n=1 Tax=Lentzea terrae TaxID=2200761 RepID=UPI0013006293|nr:hypothetical protein [Lentzea terrae]